MITEGLKREESESEWAGSLQEQTRTRRLNDAHAAVWGGGETTGEREKREKRSEG